MSIATLLSQHHHVTAVDIIPEKVEMINNRKSPIQDDYIEKYLAEKDLDLTATLDAKAAYSNADFVVIAAPTNYDSHTQHFDTSAVEAVIKLVMEYNPNAIMVIKSTMRCSARKKAMYTAIERVAAPFCDKIICISDAEKRSALDRRICREDKLQVIFNGVDIEAYENGVHGAVTRKDLNIQEDAFVVGMVGRMSPQKAPDVFVKMAKKVKDAVPNAHFIIVGNGNQEGKIRRYAECNGFSDNLYITGWVDNPMSYVELFDVACLLSRWEGLQSEKSGTGGEK